MRNLDKDGLLLCDLQAKAFELSLTQYEMSSEIFIRRFMHSEIARELDSGAILQTNLLANDILERLTEEYGESSYGSVKYGANEIYWIGYIYRFYTYTYEQSSRQAYKTVKPKELRGLFLPYHTVDPAQAIKRIMEAKGLPHDSSGELQRQYEILKRIRMSDRYGRIRT